MKARIGFASAAIGAVLSLSAVFAHAQDTQAALTAQAKISEVDARAIALAKVPNGTVQSSELEKENGLLIWSFDVAKPQNKNITEVQVDAITGKIASVKTETPAAQAEEAKADHAKKQIANLASFISARLRID